MARYPAGRDRLLEIEFNNRVQQRYDVWCYPPDHRPIHYQHAVADNRVSGVDG